MKVSLYQIFVFVVSLQFFQYFFNWIFEIINQLLKNIWDSIVYQFRLYCHSFENFYLTEKLIEEAGFNVELHHTVTSDGYKITMQRIVLRNAQQQPNRVVVLQHGLLESSSVFVLHGKHSLGIQLAAEGFDCWLLNGRSSMYGQNHCERTIHDDSFWDYTIDDLILYDFESQIKYILNHTGQEKIAYIGQSQGAAQVFGGVCVHPHLTKHIGCIIAISPAIILKNPNNLLIQALMKIPPNWWGKREFLGLVSIGQRIIPKWFVGQCGIRVMKLLGVSMERFDYEEDNVKSYRSLFFANTPQGCSSAKHLIHWFQLLERGGTICRFDPIAYENNTNKPHINPKEYDIESVAEKIPVYLFLGEHDNVVDVHQLKDKFKGKAKYIYMDPLSGHADFIWSKYACKRVNPIVIQKLKESFLL